MGNSIKYNTIGNEYETYKSPRIKTTTVKTYQPQTVVSPIKTNRKSTGISKIQYMEDTNQLFEKSQPKKPYESLPIPCVHSPYAHEQKLKTLRLQYLYYIIIEREN